MLPLSVKRLFKIPGKSSVVESIFSKVTGEIQYQHQYQYQFRKLALLEISRSYLLASVTGLQSAGCKAIKIELLTKFSEGIRKTLGNFQQFAGLQNSAQHGFEIPENFRDFCCGVSFYRNNPFIYRWYIKQLSLIISNTK